MARPGTRAPGPSGPDGDVGEPRLTVAAAARRLGIAPATLRTWDRRYGVGPSDHTPGRHRRYSADDVARLELMQHALVRGASPADAARYAQTARLPRPDADPPDRPQAVPGATAGGDADGRAADGRAADGRAADGRAADGRAADGPAAEPDDEGGPLLAGADGSGELGARVRVGGRVLRLPGAGRRARGLGRAALALDATAVRRSLVESIASIGLEVTWNEVARPVMCAVAERWANTGAGVEIEHLVSECVTGVFGAHLAAVPPVTNARPVLLVGMPGEQHILPMAVLAAVLADRGVTCRSLGPNLPADALMAAIRRTAPAAVVLWSQLVETADSAVVRSLPRTRPRFRTYAAGPGWADTAVPPRVLRLDSLVGATAAICAAVLV